MYKVLLVDDEDIIVEGLKKIVKWDKYNCAVVATAHDAKSGSAAILKHSPDILFTDIKMPGIDGLTMLAGLRSEFPNMQVTVLTGHRDFEYAKRAINMGVTRFLLKPSKMNEIEEALKVMTDRLESINEEPEETQKEKIIESESKEANSFIITSAVRYIESNYMNKLTLSELAEKIYVSQWYLSKLLNKYAEKSFYDILNQTRIDKSKELLKDPSLKIHEISEMVGFNDVAHFSRVFKKCEEVSPKEYRNRNC